MGKVMYNQSGYIGSSMSINAALAYGNGEKPKSKWTKAAMLDEIAGYCDMFDITYDECVEKLKKDELFERFFEWKSWHHTGKYANETDFYGLNEKAVIGFFDGAAEQEDGEVAREDEA